VDLRRGDELQRRVFVGVAQLRLEPTSTNWPFDWTTTSIDDRGWDELRYKVDDGVGGRVSFVCADVEPAATP
jgi:hypothetical protein